MSKYDVGQYLLDRAYLEDIAKKMYLYADLKDYDALVHEIWAEKIQMDYTSLLGGQPYEISGADQAETWKKQTASLERTQHAIAGVIITDLAPPGSVTAPETAQIVANGVISLVKGDKLNQNGGRVYLDLVRTSASGNPWRVTKMKVDIVYVAHHDDKRANPFPQGWVDTE